MSSKSQIEKLIHHVLEELSSSPSLEQLEIEKTILEIRKKSSAITEYFNALVKKSEDKISNITKTKELKGTWFRSLQSQYHDTPLNYVGSVKSSQRFNFAGEETLYFGDNYDTCFKEVRFEQYLCPTTTIAIDVKLQSILDLSTAANLKKYHIEEELLLGPWKKFNNIQIQYYSQHLARMIRTYPFEGVLYNSTVNGGQRCLAVFPMKLISGSHLKVVNPDKKMKKQFIEIIGGI